MCRCHFCHAAVLTLSVRAACAATAIVHIFVGWCGSVTACAKLFSVPTCACKTINNQRLLYVCLGWKHLILIIVAMCPCDITSCCYWQRLYLPVQYLQQACHPNTSFWSWDLIVGRVLKSVSTHCEQCYIIYVHDNCHVLEVSRRLAGVTVALGAGWLANKVGCVADGTSADYIYSCLCLAFTWVYYKFVEWCMIGPFLASHCVLII